MKQPTWMGLALALLFASSARATQSPQDASLRTTGLKIGVVNLKVCFDGQKYQKVQDSEEGFRLFTENLESNLKNLEADVKRLQDQINILEEGDKLRESKLKELAIKQFQYKMEQEAAKKKWLAEYSAIRVSIYNEIRRVVDLVGRDGNFDLVFKADEPWLDPESQESVAERIQHRPLLYWNSTIDISEKVLERLNTEYALSKKNSSQKPK